jgi:tetratricopeptide (TPR) repeat protein
MAAPADPKLGRRLRRLRLERGLSQGELAAPHYTHAYVSSIEAGRRSPSPRALHHLAEKLGVSAEELLTGHPPDLREGLELKLLEARRALSAGHIEQARSGYRSIMSEARGYGIARLEARSFLGLAHCEERAGDWEKAIEVFEDAEELAEPRFSDVHAEITAGKARCLENMGDRGHAIYLLDRTIRDLKRRGLEDPLTLIKLYAPLAYSACAAGFYTQAAEAASYALAFAPNVDDPLTLAVTHINVARSLLQQKEHEAALRSLHRAEELFDQLDLRLELGRANLALGITCAHQDRMDESITHLRNALSIFEAVGSEVDQARTLVELGRAQRKLDRGEEARSLLLRALDLLRRFEDVGEMALAHRELGLSIGPADPERAEKNLQEAIALFERSESPYQVALTHRYLGELHEAIGQDPCADFRRAALALPLEL